MPTLSFPFPRPSPPQLVQFLMIATQNAMAWWRGPNCGLSDWTKSMLIFYMGTMLILFGNFYVNKYVRRGGSSEEGERRPAGKGKGEKETKAE